MINWDKYIAAMEAETEQSELRDCWADGSGNDDHGREAAAKLHDKAAKLHGQAVTAHENAHIAASNKENMKGLDKASQDELDKQAATTKAKAREATQKATMASIAAHKGTEAASDSGDTHDASYSAKHLSNEAHGSANGFAGIGHSQTRSLHKAAADRHKVAAAKLRNE